MSLTASLLPGVLPAGHAPTAANSGANPPAYEATGDDAPFSLILQRTQASQAADGRQETATATPLDAAATAGDDPAAVAMASDTLQALLAALAVLVPAANNAPPAEIAASAQPLLAGRATLTPALDAAATRLDPGRFAAAFVDLANDAPDTADLLAPTASAPGAIATPLVAAAQTQAAAPLDPDAASAAPAPILPAASAPAASLAVKFAEQPTASADGEEIATQLDAPALDPLPVLAGSQGAQPAADRVSAPGMPQLQLSTPTGARAWPEDVGNQVKWLLGNGESKAELLLSPAGLGKIEVSIQLNGDQTSALFVASSQMAREALEEALPRLREILQQAGIDLGQTDVSTARDQGNARQNPGTTQRARTEEAGSDKMEAVSGSGTFVGGKGLVDTFA